MGSAIVLAFTLLMLAQGANDCQDILKDANRAASKPAPIVQEMPFEQQRLLLQEDMDWFKRVDACTQELDDGVYQECMKANAATLTGDRTDIGW